ncbi:uncharacterized protein LOC100907659 isoform X2 [Galendromus occidentalis]|uniref:Uncharacterized protein LOC100907659 isoform X2 n=1 Tax=Galendromus occidentalis TaxID=34638 RepID=A0AAJ7L5D6_9ACAR|nr:uncharacterized protein LOC100907659 isoform X2 [Galendromus occidentalis]
MEETFLDLVSRWLGYIALTWITYLIYLASGVSIADCLSAIFSPKKAEAPEIQVIPATPSTPDKSFNKFELPPKQATVETPKKSSGDKNTAQGAEGSVDFVLDAPNRRTRNSENTDLCATDVVTSECTESAAYSAETSAVLAAAASATSAVLPTTSASDTSDPTTRFNVTRCSFSVEKLQTLPSIKILKPEDVCPPGTLISGGLPESEL